MVAPSGRAARAYRAAQRAVAPKSQKCPKSSSPAYPAPGANRGRIIAVPSAVAGAPNHHKSPAPTTATPAAP